MKIIRTEEKGFFNRILDWKIYVRRNFEVVKASEYFYAFVGANSFHTFNDFLPAEDASCLLLAARDLKEPVELVTTLNNLDGNVRNVYLRMETCDETENDIPLLLITLFDMRDMEDRTAQLERGTAKYRHFMSLENSYYFEYTLSDNKIVIYKYMNERALTVVEETLEEFSKHMAQEYVPNEKQQEQMRTFCTHLKSGSPSFEMEFAMSKEDEDVVCRVKGGILYKDKNMVAGILHPDQNKGKEAYYLTPAARDAGTGLLNKKALTEYCVEKLQLADGKLRWFVLLDVDDFKNINDTYGHLFGDQVIRGVAEIMQVTVGHRGMIGRFGGDEYFILLESVPDRAALKTLLKTMSKEFAVAFDPQVRLTASIGVSCYPVDGGDYEELMRKADKALYLAKDKGKNRHIIYDQRLHGSLQTNDMKNMAVSYAASKEKRRDALAELLSNLCIHGVSYVTEKPEVQQLLRGIFDLDGLTIFTEQGRKLACRNGNYVHEEPDGAPGFQDERYLSLFGDGSLLVESNMLRLKAVCPEAYEISVKQEIGAAVQYLARKQGVPYAMVNFEVFNRNRKWSDEEVELLNILGSCIGRLLCEA